MKFARKILLGIFISCLLFSSVGQKVVLGQTDTPTPTPTPTPNPSSQTSNIKDCADNHISIADCPSFLQRKVNDLSSQADSLSSQIAVMDSQIKLTEARIAANQKQISDLTLDIDTTNKKITGLQDTLNNLSQVLINRVKATYEVGTIEPFQILLSSNDASNFLSRLNYLKIAQGHDRKIIFETTQAKNDYTNQKDILTDKKKQIEALKKQLEDYSKQLDQQKQSKKTLLAETQGSEASYQALLDQAKTQLAGFSSFAQSQGGATILSNQTVCDDWGCYYNQRDSQWGANSLNGTRYSLASDGCLVTSMAMVYTHYSHKSVNPQTINSDSWNFASYYPAFLNFTIRADGVVSTRDGSSISSELQSGRPVIAGIKYSNGDTHFVVLTDYNGGNYLMNDPFTPNGHKIPFTSKYSLNSIYAVYKITGF